MKNKSNPLDKARELGFAISQSSEYEDLIKAEEDYLNDSDAENLIKDLNDKKIEYNLLKNDCSKENKTLELEKEINELQEKINNNKAIQNLYSCQNNHEKLLKNINNIINFITNNDERISINATVNNKSCSSCTGCCKNRAE